MTPFAILVALVAVTVVLIVILAAVPRITVTRSGKILAFLGLFLLPAIAGWAGFDRHMERSKETSFCLSCHIMAPYGRSLTVDEKNWLPAAHYQNNRVSRDHACYTCHTNYALY